MRAVWKGAVTFGLVNVPVKLYSATEDHDVSLHQVHDEDGGRIRYQRVCEIDGKVVDYKNIDKAYDDGERTVIITDEDLKSLPAERSREIEVTEFVPTEQIDPIMFDQQLLPRARLRVDKAYVLLRRTLESTDRTAIVRMALRQKTRLAALRVHGDVLVVQTLLWSDEVRAAEFPSLDEPVRISSKELDLSKQLVESLVSDFEPDAVRRRVPGGAPHPHQGQARAGRRRSTRPPRSASSPSRRRAARSSTSWRRCASRSPSKRGGSDAAKGGTKAASGGSKSASGSKSAGSKSSGSKAASGSGDGAKKKAPAAKKKAAS